jgi:hypothetical protein
MQHDDARRLREGKRSPLPSAGKVDTLVAIDCGNMVCALLAISTLSVFV